MKMSFTQLFHGFPGTVTQNVDVYGLELKWLSQFCINTALIGMLASKGHLFGYMYLSHSKTGLQKAM